MLNGPTDPVAIGPADVEARCPAWLTFLTPTGTRSARRTVIPAATVQGDSWDDVLQMIRATEGGGLR